MMPQLSEFCLIWNLLQKRDTPRLHIRIADWLANCRERGLRRLLLLAFRGCGKSTLVGLYCAWLLLRNPDLRILVLAAEQDLATTTVRNVKGVIERHPLCRGMMPKRATSWAADRFTIRRGLELRDPSMLAKGIGANLTGSRADVILCDDVEVPNTCDSAQKRRDLRARLAEADYILTPDGSQIYIGTPHSFHSIYAAARGEDGVDGVGAHGGEEADGRPFLQGFTRLLIPVVDRQGRSAWPEKFSAAAITTLRRAQGPQKFAAQMLLTPVDPVKTRLDPDLMQIYRGELVYQERNRQSLLLLEGRRLISAGCRWDPAWGGHDGNDRSVIACVYTDEDGGWWLHRVCYLATDPRESTDAARQQCRAVIRFLADHYLPAVHVESNGLGRFLPDLLRRELKEAGQAAAVVDCHESRNKDRRILAAFDAPLAAGQIRCHESVLRTPFGDEMRHWRPGGGGHDDGLDAVAGCLLGEPVRLSSHGQGVPAPPPRWRGTDGGDFHAETSFNP